MGMSMPLEAYILNELQSVSCDKDVELQKKVAKEVDSIPRKRMPHRNSVRCAIVLFDTTRGLLVQVTLIFRHKQE